MRPKQILLSSGFLLLLMSPMAGANENQGCFGVSELVGPGAGYLFDPQNGKLALSRILSGNQQFSLSEKADTQAVKQKSFVLPLPGSDGVPRNTEVEGLSSFRYKSNRLTSAFSQTNEAGKKDAVITGKYFSYDWPKGGCRPTRITVRNRALLGEKSGVLFDAEICRFLKKKGALGEPTQAESCARLNANAFKALQEYDEQLRTKTKEKEVLVAAPTFHPGSITPLKGLNDGSIAANVLTSCSSFFQQEKEQTRGTGATTTPGAPVGAAPAE